MRLRTKIPIVAGAAFFFALIVGLHRCGNALSANNGKIYGESEGSGDGASLYIVFGSN